MNSSHLCAFVPFVAKTDYWPIGGSVAVAG